MAQNDKEHPQDIVSEHAQLPTNGQNAAQVTLEVSNAHEKILDIASTDSAGNVKTANAQAITAHAETITDSTDIVALVDQIFEGALKQENPDLNQIEQEIIAALKKISSRKELTLFDLSLLWISTDINCVNLVLKKGLKSRFYLIFEKLRTEQIIKPEQLKQLQLWEKLPDKRKGVLEKGLSLFTRIPEREFIHICEMHQLIGNSVGKLPSIMTRFAKHSFRDDSVESIAAPLIIFLCSALIRHSKQEHISIRDDLYYLIESIYQDLRTAIEEREINPTVNHCIKASGYTPESFAEEVAKNLCYELAILHYLPLEQLIRDAFQDGPILERRPQNWSISKVAVSDVIEKYISDRLIDFISKKNIAHDLDAALKGHSENKIRKFFDDDLNFCIKGKEVAGDTVIQKFAEIYKFFRDWLKEKKIAHLFPNEVIEEIFNRAEFHLCYPLFFRYAPPPKKIEKAQNGVQSKPMNQQAAAAQAPSEKSTTSATNEALTKPLTVRRFIEQTYGFSEEAECKTLFVEQFQSALTPPLEKLHRMFFAKQIFDGMEIEGRHVEILDAMFNDIRGFIDETAALVTATENPLNLQELERKTTSFFRDKALLQKYHAASEKRSCHHPLFPCKKPAELDSILFDLISAFLAESAKKFTPSSANFLTADTKEIQKLSFSIRKLLLKSAVEYIEERNAFGVDEYRKSYDPFYLGQRESRFLSELIAQNNQSALNLEDQEVQIQAAAYINEHCYGGLEVRIPSDIPILIYYLENGHFPSKNQTAKSTTALTTSITPKISQEPEIASTFTEETPPQKNIHESESLDAASQDDNTTPYTESTVSAIEPQLKEIPPIESAEFAEEEPSPAISKPAEAPEEHELTEKTRRKEEEKLSPPETEEYFPSAEPTSHHPAIPPHQPTAETSSPLKKKPRETEAIEIPLYEFSGKPISQREEELAPSQMILMDLLKKAGISEEKTFEGEDLNAQKKSLNYVCTLFEEIMPYLKHEYRQKRRLSSLPDGFILMEKSRFEKIKHTLSELHEYWRRFLRIHGNSPNAAAIKKITAISATLLHASPICAISETNLPTIKNPLAALQAMESRTQTLSLNLTDFLRSQILAGNSLTTLQNSAFTQPEEFRLQRAIKDLNLAQFKNTEQCLQWMIKANKLSEWADLLNTSFFIGLPVRNTEKLIKKVQELLTIFFPKASPPLAESASKSDHGRRTPELQERVEKLVAQAKIFITNHPRRTPYLNTVEALVEILEHYDSSIYPDQDEFFINSLEKLLAKPEEKLSKEFQRDMFLKIPVSNLNAQIHEPEFDLLEDEFARIQSSIAEARLELSQIEKSKSNLEKTLAILESREKNLANLKAEREKLKIQNPNIVFDEIVSLNESIAIVTQEIKESKEVAHELIKQIENCSAARKRINALARQKEILLDAIRQALENSASTDSLSQKTADLKDDKETLTLIRRARESLKATS